MQPTETPLQRVIGILKSANVIPPDQAIDIETRSAPEPDELELALKISKLNASLIETDTEKDKCPICMKWQKNVVLVNCRHTICSECAIDIHTGLSNKRSCPICRAEYDLNSIQGMIL